jgi:hypothetical protein
MLLNSLFGNILRINKSKNSMLSMLKNTLMIQIQVLLSTRITDRPELTKVKRLKMLLTTISPGTENNDEEEITMKKKI